MTETTAFLQGIYNNYGTRSINGIYLKAQEILNTIEMGFNITDYNGKRIKEFMFIGQQLAKVLRNTITKELIRDFLKTKEIFQITTAPIERKHFNWTIVERPNIKWQMDTIYLGKWWKEQLGWTKQKTNKKTKTTQAVSYDIIPNTHAVLQTQNGFSIVFIQPQREWSQNKVKIHWLNTSDKDWKKAKYKYTYNDPRDDKEVWKNDNKEYKRYEKITKQIDPNQLIMSGFTLTSTNKLRTNVKKKIIEWLNTRKGKPLSNPKTRKGKPLSNPKTTEYTYLLTIIDVFSKYAWVFPLQTHNGTEVAICLHELFTQPFIGKKQSPYKPKLLLSDIGTELKNPQTNFITKHNRVFQIFALPQRPLGIIERFNQTFKRKMKLAIMEGNMTKHNFKEMVERLTTEYNTTYHHTTQYKPAIAHFTNDRNIIQNIHNRLKQIKEKNEIKYTTNTIIPLDVGDRVRVLSTKDPTLSSTERNEIIQAFKYKRFARPFWTKKIFVIQRTHNNNYYTLRGYTKRFHLTELQKVFRQRDR